MKCNEIKELLSLYIDKMLDESEMKEVEEHLSACAACRKEYDDLSEMIALLGQAGMVPVPDAFGFRLEKALKEEKQNMIDAGFLSRPSKKKNQWRILTSIAAVFAVGVLSFGLYHDVLGNFPGTDGGEQTGAAQTEEAYDMKDAGTADTAKGKAADPNSTGDGSVVMKEQSSDLAPLAKTFDSDASDEIQDSNTNEMRNSNTNNAAMTPAAHPDNSAAGYYDAAQDIPMFSKAAPSPEEECSRSLTAAGVERNAAAVQYYNNLIEEKLKGFDYQVLGSSYSQTGEWQFRIFIFRGKDGNTYNEEIMIIGKEGEIQVICSDEFLGL